MLFIESHINSFYQDIKDSLSSLLHNSLKLSSSQHDYRNSKSGKRKYL